MSIVLDGTSGLTTNSGTLISASTIGVGGATPSTSGAGITFPATVSDSSSGNTLDDYEEGTFTPSMVFGSTTQTSFYGRNGKYTKIGNVVTVFVNFVAGTPIASGNLLIGNLPFTASGPDNLSSIPCALTFGGYSGGGFSAFEQMAANVLHSSTTIQMFNCKSGSNSKVLITGASMGDGCEAWISASYYV